MRDVVRAVLTALNGHSIVSVLGALLTDSHFADCVTRAVFINEWESFLYFAQQCSLLSTDTTKFCSQVYTKLLAGEIAGLASKESGWHFSAKNAKVDQIEAFSLTNMASILEHKAPLSWNLFGSLLQSDPVRLRRRLKDLGLNSINPQACTGGESIWDDEDEYWESLSIVGDDLGPQGDNERPSKRRRRAGDRYVALLRIVSLHDRNLRLSTNDSLETSYCDVHLTPEYESKVQCPRFRDGLISPLHICA